MLVDARLSVGSWAEIHVRERMLFVWVEDRLSLGWFVAPLLCIYERNLKCRVEIVRCLAQVDDSSCLSLNPFQGKDLQHRAAGVRHLLWDLWVGLEMTKPSVTVSEFGGRR